MTLTDPAAQEMFVELERTGVLSKEFKDKLITLLIKTIDQAYERGTATPRVKFPNTSLSEIVSIIDDVEEAHKILDGHVPEDVISVKIKELLKKCRT